MDDVTYNKIDRALAKADRRLNWLVLSLFLNAVLICFLGAALSK